MVALGASDSCFYNLGNKDGVRYENDRQTV